MMFTSLEMTLNITSDPTPHLEKLCGYHLKRIVLHLVTMIPLKSKFWLSALLNVLRRKI